MNMVGPIPCRSDVKKKGTKKTWSLIIEDAGPVHQDVVSEYSTDSLLLTL